MSTLVQFLASGVNGAANGSATFVLRGTASSAASVLYNDFEMTSQPGTNIITLDANGAAEVYCNAYVDVTLKTSAGATIRTVTVGNSATTLEVISDSFTGTAYSGSPTAVSQPITLAAILDKWNNSAGANDFKVLSGGVATNLSSAIAGFSGIFANVKDPQYGAVGDGVTNDQTAIQNAITGAAGGIVFFPPGTYLVSQLSISQANICFMGSGTGATIIKSVTASTMVSLTDNTATAWKIFKDIKFTVTGSATDMFDLEQNQNVSFQNCEFDGTLCSNIFAVGVTAGKSNFYFDACNFTLGSATVAGILNSGVDGEKNFYISSCFFKVNSGFTGVVVNGPDASITGCTFDASAVTSGAYYHIDSQSNGTSGRYLGNFTGNKFIDGGSSGFVFALTSITNGCVFRETNNTLSGFTASSTITDQGHIYDYSTSTLNNNNVVELGSRSCKMIGFTNALSAVSPLAHIASEMLVISHTANSNLSVQPSSSGINLPAGSKFTIVVQNDHASAHDITFTDTGTSFTESAVPAGGIAVASYIAVMERSATVYRTVCMDTYQASI